MRKFNLVLVALIAALSLSSCGEKNTSSGQAVLKAHFNGGAGMSLILKNTDPFSLDADTFKVDGGGNIVITQELKGPVYLNFQMPGFGNVPFTVFLIPGDTLFLETDMSDFFRNRKYSGNGAVYNNYIANYVISSNAFQQNIRGLFSQVEKVAMKSVDSLHQVNIAALEQFKKNNSDIDPIFEKIESARVLYEWALLHNIYPMYYKYFTKDQSYTPSPEFVSYLGECDLNDESIFSLDLYKIFLTTYVGMKMEDYYADEELMAKFPSVILYRLNLIDKAFTNPKIKELMAFEAVRDYVKQEGIKNYDSYIDIFKKICTNSAYLSVIDEMVGDWLHLKKGADSYNFSFVDMQGNKVSMSDFKGKYVYMDVWATWCSPCRAEIPYLKKMEEDFHGKNIVFMSISVDQTQEPWKKMVVSDDLKGVQLWAGQAKEFSSFYKINGIPRFMLFDMEGKILETNATRPSGEVDKQLAELPGI